MASSSNALVCQNPASYTLFGSQAHDVGYESCDGGWLHRSRAVECPSALPRAEAVTGYRGDTCEDASCAGPHGFCIAIGGVGPTSTTCMPGCVRDDEYDAGQICLCDDPVGRCVPGVLHDGRRLSRIALRRDTQSTGVRGPDAIFFACADPHDECLTGHECTNGKRAPASDRRRPRRLTPCSRNSRRRRMPELEQHGLCPAARLQHARRQALLQIVMPLARALFVDSNDTPSRAAGDGIPLRA